MTRTFEAKIIYKVNANHPDLGDLPESEWKDKEFTYEDTYHINPDFFWGEDHIMEHIQEDLLLTAGGGYNWKGLSEYKFEIEEVR